jgi:PAS domain S-box-containing protein
VKSIIRPKTVERQRGQPESRTRGLLVTLLTVAVLEFLSHTSLRVPNPGIPVLIAVVYSASVGGVRSGLLSSALGLLYAIWFFGFPEGTLYLSAENFRRLIVLAGALPGCALMVGFLWRRAEAGTQAAMEAETSRRVRNLVEDLDAIVWEADPETWRFTFLNRKAESLLGVSLDQMQADPEYWVRHLHPEDRDSIVELCKEAIRDRRDRELEYRMIAADGRIVWFRDIVHVGLDAADQPVILRGVMVDITARKEAERILQESEERYRYLFDSNPHVMWVYDLQTLRFLAVNEAAVRTYGYSRDEFLGMTIREIRPPEDVPRLLQTVRELAGASATSNWRHRKKDGTLLDVEIRSHPFEFGGRAARLVLVLDVTERKRAEEALHGAEQMLRTVVTNAPLVLFALDAGGVFTLSEGTGLKALGLRPGEVVGRSVFEIYQGIPRICENARRALAGETFFDVIEVGSLVFETGYAPLRGSGGKVTGVIGVATDVTERRHLEAQLRQAQKMEAVGRLAGGVAHDFNNLLTAIGGYSELLQTRWGGTAHGAKELEEIRKACQRATALTRQLLAFSRRQVLEPKVLDLNAVVTRTEQMLRRLIGEDVDLITSLHPSLGRVRADPSQVEQILMNLVVNARDAMPQGGRVVVETANVELGPSFAARHPETQPGPYVMLAVSDTGSGMDPETLAHLFEPFFTTKGPGEGTGLGLSTVYGIVRQSGGNIWAYSEPGRGSTFKIYLPRAEEAAESVPEAARVTPRLRGNETILVVEDEKIVRSLALEILKMHGYSVLEARNGTEALKVAARHSGTIHLMLTDVVMPQMGGPELVQRLQPLRPEMRILYMSGYTGGALVQQGVLAPETALLSKPFGVDALARKIREILDQPD